MLRPKTLSLVMLSIFRNCRWECKLITVNGDGHLLMKYMLIG